MGVYGNGVPQGPYTRGRCLFEAADAVYKIVGEEGEALSDAPTSGTDIAGTALAAATGTKLQADAQPTIGPALAARNDEPASGSEAAAKKRTNDDMNDDVAPAAKRHDRDIVPDPEKLAQQQTDNAVKLFYITPDFSPPNLAIEGDLPPKKAPFGAKGCEARRETSWRFTENTSMSPFWAVRRMTASERQRLTATMNEPTFNCEVRPIGCTNLTQGRCGQQIITYSCALQIPAIYNT